MAKNKKSFAELMLQAQTFATGLKNNQADVAKRGLEEDFVVELEKFIAEANTLNSEQEKLKADLKLKTEALNAKADAIAMKLSEAKKVIKLALAQPKWKEFGFDDKR